MLLMWDAMGYNCGIRYDKHTGQLIGLSEDFHFGLCAQRFSNKVNVLKVVSPEKDISISFPVCHHHVHTLNSTQIYTQVMEVVENLYNISGIRSYCRSYMWRGIGTLQILSYRVDRTCVSIPKSKCLHGTPMWCKDEDFFDLRRPSFDKKR